jgi:hypothetical protein
MEAARVAALRGHRVRLFERTTTLGGQVASAALATNRVELRGIVDWMEHELERLSVELIVGTTISSGDLPRLGADWLIVATGSTGRLPAWASSTSIRVLDVVASLHDPASLGQRVVIVDDDRHYKAAGAAEYFADLGKSVVLATHGGATGSELPATTASGLHERLRQKGVRCLPFHHVRDIGSDTVLLGDSFSNQTLAISPVDTIVWAGPNIADDELVREGRGLAPPILVVGDALAPRRLLDAIRDGHTAGRSVGSSSSA